MAENNCNIIIEVEVSKLDIELTQQQANIFRGQKGDKGEPGSNIQEGGLRW